MDYILNLNGNNDFFSRDGIDRLPIVFLLFELTCIGRAPWATTLCFRERMAPCGDAQIWGRENGIFSWLWADLWLGWLELQECLVKLVLSLGVGLKPSYNWGGTTSPPPRTQNHDLVWVTPLLMRQMIQNNGAWSSHAYLCSLMHLRTKSFYNFRHANAFLLNTFRMQYQRIEILWVCPQIGTANTPQ